MDTTIYTLITGASGGIGLELAKLAASDGKNLILAARTAQALEALAKELSAKYKIKAVTYPVDLASEANTATFISALQQKGYKIDTLINNAGFGDFGDFAEADIQRNMEMLRLNINALTALTYYCLQDMKKAGRGRIMNVSSIAAFMPGPGMSVYYASKAYVLSFSEALARELKGSGITVTALCPGPTDTGFATAAGLGKSLLTRFMQASKAAPVARAGYNAMLKGKAVVVPGISNRLSATMTAFMPRSVVRNLVYSIHKNH